MYCPFKINFMYITNTLELILYIYFVNKSRSCSDLMLNLWKVNRNNLTWEILIHILEKQRHYIYLLLIKIHLWSHRSSTTCIYCIKILSLAVKIQNTLSIFQTFFLNAGLQSVWLIFGHPQDLSWKAEVSGLGLKTKMGFA